MSHLGTQILLTEETLDAETVFSSVRELMRRLRPADMVAAVERSGLRGRGGAGFPAGIKWRGVAEQEAERKYVVVNGAEGEPGSFKDRLLMRERPHLVLAGTILAAYAVGAGRAYVYIHHEADDCMEAMEAAYAAAREAGLLGEDAAGTGTAIEVQNHVAGIGYVAGEETAVLRFIEGDVPKPRPKPPYPTQKGLWGFPTLVNNVETIANVEPLLRMGAEAFRSVGTPDTPGTVLVSLNGVRRPGVYEVEAGRSLGEVVFDLGGGPVGCRQVKAVLPGGYSSAFLPGDALDAPLEHTALKDRGTSLGAANMWVYEEGVSMAEVAVRLMRFFAAETCGQCFPCRKGTRDLLQCVLDAARGDGSEGWDERVGAVFDLVGRKTICGLDKAAGKVMRSLLDLFGHELAAGGAGPRAGLGAAQ